jgi:CheY-like chemotaxis protein
MDRGGYFAVDALKGVHVLMVERDAVARRTLDGALRYCGALVTAVPTPRVALAAMRVVHPDVLLVGIAARGAGARDFLRRVRALKPDDGGIIPAIALGHASAAAARTRALGWGFRDYLAWPVDPWALARLISSLVPGS